MAACWAGDCASGTFGRKGCPYGARARSGYPRFHTGGPMSTLTHSPAWQALTRHAESMRDVQVRDLFAAASARFNDFSLEVDDLLVDFSKNRITADTLSLLFALARQEEIFTWRDRMMSGDRINRTENRAVLHVALRNRSNRPILVDGQDVMPGVNAVLAQIRKFTDAVRSGAWKGHTGKRI